MIKVEELEPILESTARTKSLAKLAKYTTRVNHRIGPLGIMQPFKYENYDWKYKNETTRNRECLICRKAAKYIAYFKIHKAEILERYCSQCLDKWVAIPNQ